MTQLELWQKTEKKELLRKLLMHRSQSELKPVSSVQSDLLKRQFRFPNEINSNIYGTVSADYKLEPAKIEQILNELANTHEFFRTRFSWNHGYPVYTLDTTTNINDLLSVHEVHDPKEAQEKIDHFLQTPMEVFSGPPIRFLISNIFPNHSFFTVVTHHCLLDGDALFRLLQIIGYHYQNSTPQKPKKDTDQTYANFVAQETLDILRGAPKALSRLQTWLTDLSPSQFTPNYSLGLRKDCRPEPILRRIQKSEFTLVHTLNSESYRRFSTFLWLWAKHLKIWYHLENLAIAIPHTRRFTGSHHHILGSMADYFPLFITNNHCPNEEIRNIDCQLINIIDGHQDSSFSFLQRLVEREHGSIHRHLSQTVFDYQDFSRIEELQKDFKFIEGGRLGLPPGTELSLSIREFNSELFVRLDYNKNLFCPWDMEKLVDHFIQKLSGTRENTTFGENLPPIAKNIPDSLPNFSTRIATNLPHLSPSIITDQNQVWTSEKLQEEILRWKRTFHNLKLCAGDIVSVSLDRSCEYISIVIAIWDLGGIYLPIDSNAPLNRITQMLKESGTRFFVAAQESLDPEKLKILVPSLIYLDPKKSPPIATLEKIQSYPLGSQAPAYILYTSGSTGRPKGAMVHHGGLDNHTQAFTQYFHITSQDIIAQTASVLFDISVWQLTQFAWTGAQTVILADEVVSDPLQLLPALHRHAVTIAELTPTQLKLALSCAENPPP